MESNLGVEFSVKSKSDQDLFRESKGIWIKNFFNPILGEGGQFDHSMIYSVSIFFRVFLTFLEKFLVQFLMNIPCISSKLCLGKLVKVWILQS